MSGQLIAQRGNTDSMNTTVLSALAASDFAATAEANKTICEKVISEARVIYAGQEKADNHCDCGDEDVFVVHAHGSKKYTRLYDDAGGDAHVAAHKIVQQLIGMGANEASSVWFIICHSAMKKHIGPTWKQANVPQPVFGSELEIQGGIVSLTGSNRIRSSIFKDQGRMKRLIH